MRAERLYWTLVFTPASLEHLEEREIGAEDVADVVWGVHGPARVRRVGRGVRERWFVVGPLSSAEFLTCVLRRATPRDLDADDAFVISSIRDREAPGSLTASMRLCVSARMSDGDEIRSYRGWRRSKGGQG